MAHEKNGEVLQISRCSCETGRERYRVFDKRTRISDFEHHIPVIIPDDEVEHVDVGVDESESEGENEDEGEGGINFGGVQILDAEELVIQVIGDGGGAANVDDFLEDEELMAQAVDEAGDVGTIDDDESDIELDEDFEEGSQDSTSGSDTEDEGFGDRHHKIPTIARWRLNLTALSQKYNLYFVVYKDQIHVSRPRSCITHALPPKADLVMVPGPSMKAMCVGGTLDMTFPHQVNHLIVGQFGEEEILLMAYDDGDVIGYYTQRLEDEICRREADPPTKHSFSGVRPFFHENVDRSAWALAVHKKSRLIAVGANTHAVTVFIPALEGSSYVPIEGTKSYELYRTLVRDRLGKIDAKSAICDPHEAESILTRRDANWRLVLQTDHHGENIPNLTFGDDEDGNAEMIVAVDISGNLWLMDIWKLRTRYQRIKSIYRGHPHAFPGQELPRGWGVVVANEDSFLRTDGFQNSLGVSEKEARFGYHSDVGRWIDISKGIKNVPCNATIHPLARVRRTNRSRSDVHDDLVEHNYWLNNYRSSRVGTDSRTSTTDSEFCYTLLDGSKGHPYEDQEDDEPGLVLGDGSSILRLYETDIELRSHEDNGVGITMQHASKQIQLGRPLHWASERLSNNIHVPELSLVIAGSMSGRVTLITLTRPINGNLQFQRGFKVEAILPTKKDEEDRLRPICPLFGVACGPLPMSSAMDSGDGVRPRRYRLMLQYYDLRILSYEISRGVESDELAII